MYSVSIAIVPLMMSYCQVSVQLSCTLSDYDITWHHSLLVMRATAGLKWPTYNILVLQNLFILYMDG